MTKETLPAVQIESREGETGQLSERQLTAVVGGSLSWGISNKLMCDGSVRPAASGPVPLLPAVQ